GAQHLRLAGRDQRRPFGMCEVAGLDAQRSDLERQATVGATHFGTDGNGSSVRRRRHRGPALAAGSRGGKFSAPTLKARRKGDDIVATEPTQSALTEKNPDGFFQG